jgi:hypothetical protein
LPLNITPQQARVWLSGELSRRQDLLNLYRAYYRGDHRLQFATTKFKEAFGKQLEAFATNWCGLVVDSVVDRMHVEGFSFGNDKGAQESARKIWSTNRLNAAAMMAHTEAVKCGWTYLLVTPRQGKMPRITVEHPSQVVLIVDPQDPAERLIAYKRFVEFGQQIEVVYTPETITTFRTHRTVEVMTGMGLAIPAGMEIAPGEETTVPNPLGVVPVLPLENNPDLVEGGISDLRPAIALNDAANKFFLDMLIASEYGAYPQRILMGVEEPEEKDKAELAASIGRVWYFTNAIEISIQHLAAQTRTPPHYLLSKLMNLSGDALKAAEAGLVHRARRKFVDFGDPWRDAMQVAFLCMAKFGPADERAAFKERSVTEEGETLWGDPEEQAPGAIADSLVKKQTLNWPQEMLWREGGMSPQEVEEAKKATKVSGSKLTAEDIALRRAAQVPYEHIWKEMGYTPAEVKEMSKASPLPGTIGTPRQPQQPAPVDPQQDPRQTQKAQQLPRPGSKKK